MRRTRIVLGVLAMVLPTACGSADAPTTSNSGATPTTVTTAPIATSPPTSPVTETSVADSIPTVNAAADQGCVDEAGTLHADAAAWYPGDSGSPPGLGGSETTTSADLVDFTATATAALTPVAPGFVLENQFEYHARVSNCVSHRYAVYSMGEERIVVSAWRLTSAADPFWIPNDAEFTVVDGSTLVSRGEHIAIALAVAPDGTTARITAYGSRASEMVSGWPTTTTSRGNTPAGPAPFAADDLVPIARTVLEYVLDQR